MYYYIKGELVLTEINTAVIDAGGVGYFLTISGSTLGAIASKVGTEVRLFTYLSVKEDAMELYGFSTLDELSAFKMLISVSGVGAKSAISILSLMSPKSLSAAIVTGDSKAISRAQGIGAKTAARIVLELKDKAAKELPPDSGNVSLTPDFEITLTNKSSEALNALLVLGYTRAEANYALKDISPDCDLETMIKMALTKLMKN